MISMSKPDTTVDLYTYVAVEALTQDDILARICTQIFWGDGFAASDVLLMMDVLRYRLRKYMENPSEDDLQRVLTAVHVLAPKYYAVEEGPN